MTISSRDLKASLELFEFAPGKRASWGTLKSLLPDVETALFFAKAYSMTYTNLSELLSRLYKSDVLDAFLLGEHSTELQGYYDEVVPDHIKRGTPNFNPQAAVGEILPELWEQIEVTIANSIQEVAEKIGSVLDMLPSNQGRMMFSHLNKLNKQRPTIGSYEATIKHQRQGKNLVILDVSGSMSSDTIQKIVDDVVALSYTVDASMAIVSNTCTAWDAGTFDTRDVLNAAEYGGTRYEQLVPLLNQDWDVVVTIADYDSSSWAKGEVAKCTGRIGKVVDVSLVQQPTYLAECVGQLADEVQPMLVGQQDLRYV